LLDLASGHHRTRLMSPDKIEEAYQRALASLRPQAEKARKAHAPVHNTAREVAQAERFAVEKEEVEGGGGRLGRSRHHTDDSIEELKRKAGIGIAESERVIHSLKKFDEKILPTLHRARGGAD